MFKPRCTVAVVCVTLSGTAVADTLHVPGDYPTIQEAIDAAMDGDEVEVHPGTYNEVIDFLGKAITVRSSDGPEETIIDAQQTGTVVTCNNGEGPDTVLDGFTVTGGEPSGMRNVGSSATVTNCTFSGNTAVGGGGDGGGMYNVQSSPMVTSCTFSGNSADDRGGGMYNIVSSPTVTNCTFSGNTADFGSGMFNDFLSSPTVTNCTFSNNTAEFRGGGMYNFVSSPTVTNCAFSCNTADFGAGMSNDNSNSALTNCTFAGNAADNGGGVHNLFSSLTVINCVIWGNSPDQLFDEPFSTSAALYSDIQGGWPGIGNIDADPLFVDPENEDNHLSAGSPCIDAADNTAVPLDEFDLDGDDIFDEPIPFDLDGNPRFVDDPDTIDTGNGDPPVVDMGAYEFQGITCPWDLDGDGTVGILDLLVLLAAWGTDPGGPPDFDGDGSVGILDLLALLAAWGPNPGHQADLDGDGTVGILDLLTLLANWGPCV